MNNRKSKDIATLLILLACGYFVWSSFYLGKYNSEPKTHSVSFERRAGDISIGNENAEIKVIEYLSLSCSHCAHFSENYLQTLIDEYVETNQVEVIFRQYPLDDVSFEGAKLLLCSKSEKFELLKTLLANKKQSSLRKMHFMNISMAEKM